MSQLSILLFSAVLFALGACSATRSLGTLQAEFGNIVQQQNACATGARKDSPTCLADFAATFAAIEKEALAAAMTLQGSADIGDQQIAIGLYRLAAFASLQSNSDQAATYAAAGRALCASKSLTAAPPRDCALLEVAGQYEVVNEFTGQARCLTENRCPDGITADRPGAANLVDTFCNGVYRPLQTKTAAAKAVEQLPASASAYLDRQLALTRDTMRALHQHVLSGIRPSQWPEDPCACLGDSPGAKCGNLSPAQLKARCILSGWCQTNL